MEAPGDSDSPEAGVHDNFCGWKTERKLMSRSPALSNRIISHLPKAACRLYPVAHYSVATDRSLYKIFGVNRNATHQEIKEAFYRLSKLYHPDVTNEPHARAKFQELTRAYEVLGNPSKRKEYDRGLIRPSSSSVSSDGTVAADIDAESIHSSTMDSFSTFYVKQYNRVLNEDWLRKSDPQLLKTAIEYKQDERNFILTFYTTFAVTLTLVFAYLKLTEQPIELLDLSASEQSKH
ncbi:chaperone protein DnaJ [Clonorchis sinensis]|uniref:Chaperone protein DnaJ n=1 Tax=Clonorchis sinensis TaxID=79923 RepID=G7Y2R2_CLOSI|nr:chaperone protein DnaJ [Clonorchis sinensis]